MRVVFFLWTTLQASHSPEGWMVKKDALEAKSNALILWVWVLVSVD